MTPEKCNKTILMLERRVSRERAARKTAEGLIEERSRELYQLNQQLLGANSDLQKLTLAVEQSPAIVAITDLNGNVEYINKSFSNITGYQQSDVIGKDIRFLEVSASAAALKAIDESMQKKEVWKGKLWNKKKNNDDFLVSLTISPIFNNNNEISHYLYNCEDITQQKQNEDKIHHLAHHDSLTNLYNRFSLEDRLSQALSQASRSKEKIAVLYLDLDRFKVIND